MKKVLYLPVSPEELNRQTNITTNYQRMIADDMRSAPNGQTRILSLDGDNLLRASSPTGLQLLLSNRSTNTYLNAIAGIVGDVDTARYLQNICPAKAVPQREGRQARSASPSAIEPPHIAKAVTEIRLLSTPISHPLVFSSR